MGNAFIKRSIIICTSIELSTKQCRTREEGRVHIKYAESQAQGICMESNGVMDCDSNYTAL